MRWGLECMWMGWGGGGEFWVAARVGGYPGSVAARGHGIVPRGSRLHREAPEAVVCVCVYMCTFGLSRVVVQYLWPHMGGQLPMSLTGGGAHGWALGVTWGPWLWKLMAVMVIAPCCAAVAVDKAPPAACMLSALRFLGFSCQELLHGGVCTLLRCLHTLVRLLQLLGWVRARVVAHYTCGCMADKSADRIAVPCCLAAHHAADACRCLGAQLADPRHARLGPPWWHQLALQLSCLLTCWLKRRPHACVHCWGCTDLAQWPVNPCWSGDRSPEQCALEHSRKWHHQMLQCNENCKM